MCMEKSWCGWLQLKNMADVVCLVCRSCEVHEQCWSSLYALDTQTGELVLLDPDNGGRSISSVSLKKGIPIHSIQWYGAVSKCHTSAGASYDSQSLSAYLRNGIIVLFRSINSLKCVYSETDVSDGVVAWSPSSTMLAVVGYSKQDSFSLICHINPQGYTIFTLHNALPHIPRPQVTNWWCVH